MMFVTLRDCVCCATAVGGRLNKILSYLVSDKACLMWNIAAILGLINLVTFFSCDSFSHMNFGLLMLMLSVVILLIRNDMAAQALDGHCFFYAIRSFVWISISGYQWRALCRWLTRLTFLLMPLLWFGDDLSWITIKKNSIEFWKHCCHQTNSKEECMQ